METGEGNHVDGKLPQVGIELTREPQAGGDSGHGERYQVVEVTVGWVGQLEGPEADVIQSLVVDTERLVRVLDQLVDRQSGVIGLHHRIRHLGGMEVINKHIKGGQKTPSPPKI